MNKKHVLGLNATKSHICYALMPTGNGVATPSKTSRLSIVDERPTSIVDNLCAIFDSLRAEFGEFDVAICECSAGTHGSSVEAIKAEALMEFTCEKHGIQYQGMHPNGFRKALDCPPGLKWQQRAKVLFNGAGQIKNFSGGVDGAAAAAYRLIRESSD